MGKETLGSGCFSKDNQQHSPLRNLTAFPIPHLCKTPLKILKLDFIINFFILYQPITQPSHKGHLGVTAKATNSGISCASSRREVWRLKEVIQKVPSVHHLGRFAEGKNCDPSSRSPSADPFLTPTAATSPLPVPDVPGLGQGLQPWTLPRIIVPRAISGLLWPKHLGSALQTRCPLLGYQEM